MHRHKSEDALKVLSGKTLAHEVATAQPDHCSRTRSARH